MNTKRFYLTAVLFITLALILISCARMARWQETHTPPDDACRHCHYSIYKNWKVAYRPYNEAAKREDYEPVHSSPMSARDVAKERGHKLGKGDCYQCHVTAEPKERLTISKIGASFEETTFQLCGRCHASTFEEWKWSRFATENVGCLDCHTYSDDQALRKKEDYYHTKEGITALSPDKINPAIRIDKLKKALTLSENVVIAGDEIVLSLMIANKGAGHNIPTGAIEAALLVTIKVIDKNDRVMSAAKRLIGAGGESPISPDGELFLYIELVSPGKGDYSIDITFDHIDNVSGKEAPVKVLQKRVKLRI